MQLDTQLSVLHLGCGRKKEIGAFGVDLVKFPEVDLVHDLDSFPYPMKSDSFEKVLAIDVLEHVGNLVGAVDEIYRVCRDGAEVHITGPYATSMDRHHDPTHKRGFTRLTFDYFIEGSEHFQRYGYSKGRFTRVRWGFRMNSPLYPWRRLAMKLANLFPGFYERYFAHLYPMDYVFFVLKVRK
ncbi:MAG: methyltransferase domain-containing protein [Bdellovibrionia bacterium]